MLSRLESACATRIELNKLTSLIISISLKVSRSSQSTFTMWPCRWAFVSWMERWEGLQRNEHIILAKSKEKNTETAVLLNWSQHGGWCANSPTDHAQCQRPIQHLRTLSSQSTHQLVSVGVGNVSTHLATNRKPTTQLRRINTYSLKQHMNW